MRPTRIVTAAGMLAVAGFGLTTWATDPAWARTAGLDVWNVGELEDRLRAIHAERVRLEDQEAVLRHVIERNRQLARDVAAGRRSLADAAEVFLLTNRDRPGFVPVLARYFHGPTPAAKAAHHILYKIEIDPETPRAAKAPVLERLRAEYAAAFGVPPPEGKQ